MRALHRSPVLALLALLLFAAPAVAQRAPLTLSVGDTVRVFAPTVSPRPLVGTLTAYRHNGLAVRDERTGTEQVVAFSALERLARGTGVHRRRAAISGLRRGAFLGAAIGVVSGPLIATGDTRDDWEIANTTVATTVGGALLGSAVGGALGWVLAREEWVEFRLPVRGAVSWTTDGAPSAAVSIRTR
ncbi:MAG TPA: hypothetical protein VE913_03410 [Longimicrobium sp.]|nr:hypothetical protein [Longimicrobium sp.]